MKIDSTEIQTQLWSGELEGFSKMQETFKSALTTFGDLCESEKKFLTLL
jgi:hypothetical protein